MGETLTWKQFKEEVEAKLREQGVPDPDSTYISYIDVGIYPEPGSLRVSALTDNAFTVS